MEIEQARCDHSYPDPEITTLQSKPKEKKKNSVVKKKNINYAGSEKSLPTIIKKKEPLWYRVP
jgi:hypothetical protein